MDSLVGNTMDPVVTGTNRDLLKAKTDCLVKSPTMDGLAQMLAKVHRSIVRYFRKLAVASSLLHL